MIRDDLGLGYGGEIALKQLIRDVIAEVKPTDEVLPDDYRPAAYWSIEQAEGYKTAIDEMEAKAKEMGL